MLKQEAEIQQDDMEAIETNQRMAGQSQELQRISTILKTIIVKKLLSVRIAEKLDTIRTSVENKKKLGEEDRSKHCCRAVK